MKDNRDVLKAFIHSLITLVLLYVLLNVNISFMNDILEFIVAIYLLVVFMFHITFIFTRCLNLRTLFKGRIGNGDTLIAESEGMYVVFMILWQIPALSID